MQSNASSDKEVRVGAVGDATAGALSDASVLRVRHALTYMVAPQTAAKSGMCAVGGLVVGGRSDSMFLPVRQFGNAQWHLGCQ